MSGSAASAGTTLVPTLPVAPVTSTRMPGCRLLFSTLSTLPLVAATLRGLRG
ncbi:hypothetical protein [Streptomyces microflavus]|uniref:hypothetical protein n=1 Tax=Streptomyces microflavus TaxID=1919 RepID=UPI0036E035BE